jgi:uncharacterized protein YdhG (YjbR/CyaY superfamily)
MARKPKTVSQYIAAAPAEARPHLREILDLLRKAAPGAKEALKWGAPSLSYDRILFSVSAFKKNLGFMPTPAIIKSFKDELKDYAVTPAVIHFEYGKPLPKRLITKIAKARVADYRENDSRWM